MHACNNALLHGFGCSLFSLHMYSTCGLFASKLKVKLFPVTNGLHTGWFISRFSSGTTEKNKFGK